MTLTFEQILQAKNTLDQIKAQGFADVASAVVRLQGYNSLNEYCKAVGISRSVFRKDRERSLNALDMLFLKPKTDNDGA